MPRGGLPCCAFGCYNALVKDFYFARAHCSRTAWVCEQDSTIDAKDPLVLPPPPSRGKDLHNACQLCPAADPPARRTMRTVTVTATVGLRDTCVVASMQKQIPDCLVWRWGWAQGLRGGGSKERLESDCSNHAGSCKTVGGQWGEDRGDLSARAWHNIRTKRRHQYWTQDYLHLKNHTQHQASWRLSPAAYSYPSDILCIHKLYEEVSAPQALGPDA